MSNSVVSSSKWGVVSHKWNSGDSVSNNRGGVYSAVVDRGGVGNGVGHNSLGILGLAVIGHIGDIAIIGGGVVVDMLDPAIGKSDRVGSLSVASTVRGLRGLEVGLGVVISHSIGVGVGGDHIRLSMVGGGVVSRGGMNHRGVDSVSHNRGGVYSVPNVAYAVTKNRSSMDSMTYAVTKNWSSHSMVTK